MGATAGGSALRPGMPRVTSAAASRRPSRLAWLTPAYPEVLSASRLAPVCVSQESVSARGLRVAGTPLAASAVSGAGSTFSAQAEEEAPLTFPDDGRAEGLADWVRAMDLADQIFVTGTTLVLEDIRTRRDDLPLPFDEAKLRESGPEEAYELALELSEGYASFSPRPGLDGVDEHRRISNMTRELAERIAKYHPEVLVGGR